MELGTYLFPHCCRQSVPFLSLRQRSPGLCVTPKIDGMAEKKTWDAPNFPKSQICTVSFLQYILGHFSVLCYLGEGRVYPDTLRGCNRAQHTH